MKYVVCISARAKDRLDNFRLSHELGRFPVRHLVHGDYVDNRPPAARKNETFSMRQRPATIQTNLPDEKLAELLELVELLDLTAHHSNTDSALASHLLGTFLDAVIMGDLVDATAHDLIMELDIKVDKDGHNARQSLPNHLREQIAVQVSHYNLSQAASK